MSDVHTGEARQICTAGLKMTIIATAPPGMTASKRNAWLEVPRRVLLSVDVTTHVAVQRLRA